MTGDFMAKAFEPYSSVRIKATGVTGVIVAADADGGIKPPIYFEEKDESFKNGDPNNDCMWCEPEEIERREKI